eukprot:scaffold264707_cov17-Prasinocladus_malaysianus.AAC.1
MSALFLLQSTEAILQLNATSLFTNIVEASGSSDMPGKSVGRGCLSKEMTMYARLTAGAESWHGWHR